MLVRRRQGCGFYPWVRKIPRSRKWQPSPVFLPRKFHGQRRLEGYSPWDCKHSDTTEHARMHMHVHISYSHVIHNNIVTEALNFYKCFHIAGIS